MKKYVVSTLNEYIELLEGIAVDQKELWFRGQSNCEYRLSPSSLREIYAVRDNKNRIISPPIRDDVSSGSNNTVAMLPVDQMVQAFKEKASGLLEYEATTNIEWECIAQHYGIPTRVLDWTTNAINALYFAVCDCSIGTTKENDINEFLESGFCDGGGAVFVIDPLEINRKSVPIKGFEENPIVFDAIQDAGVLDKCLHNLIAPVCFTGFNKEKRISRQAGNFSTTGTLVLPMDYYNVFQDLIIKIFIPYSSYNIIRKQLNALGITHNSIYVESDEKDIIAKEIAKETREEFLISLRK